MISYASKSDETYTVAQFIDMRSTDANTYYNYSILGYLKGIEYPLTNILYDYQDELEDPSVSVYIRMTDLEFAKYKYKPWLLAYDIYGSQEMEFIFFALNDILCDREFDIPRIRVIRKDVISTILGRIYSSNIDFVNNNRSDISVDIKNDKTTENVVW